MYADPTNVVAPNLALAGVQPARTWMPRACTASRIDIAQLIARWGPSNIAKKPSPDVFTSRPRNRSYSVSPSTQYLHRARVAD
jgi:hypothetical protein